MHFWLAVGILDDGVDCACVNRDFVVDGPVTWTPEGEKGGAEIACVTSGATPSSDGEGGA